MSMKKKPKLCNFRRHWFNLENISETKRLRLIFCCKSVGRFNRVTNNVGPRRP